MAIDQQSILGFNLSSWMWFILPCLCVFFLKKIFSAQDREFKCEMWTFTTLTWLFLVFSCFLTGSPLFCSGGEIAGPAGGRARRLQARLEGLQGSRLGSRRAQANLQVLRRVVQSGLDPDRLSGHHVDTGTERRYRVPPLLHCRWPETLAGGRFLIVPWISTPQRRWFRQIFGRNFD